MNAFYKPDNKNPDQFPVPFDKRRAVKLHTQDHFLAEVIANDFGEPERFASYLGIVRRVGFQEAFRIYREVKQSHPRHAGKLFFHLTAGKHNTL